MKKNTHQLFVFLMVILTSIVSFAEAEGLHEEERIPFDKIGWQAVNLGILLIIIYFGIRKSIKETFAKRQQDFLDQSEKTKAALVAAEEQLVEIKTKLSRLETGENQAIENAQHEANLLKATLIKDAETLSLQIKEDALLAIKAELVKAKAEINALLLNQAIQKATDKLTSGGPVTNKSIEAQFMNQVERAQGTKASV